MSFQKISKFSYWFKPHRYPTYMHVDFIYTDIPTYKRREIKYFRVILPMRIDSYALLAARYARGELFFDMHAH